MLRLSLLLLTLLSGCASRGEVRATADYDEWRGTRAGVQVAAQW